MLKTTTFTLSIVTFSPLYRQEKTISEYEMRIQALNTQLRVAQTQVGTLEDQLRSAEHGRGQLEHQLYTAKQENANLTYRNAEIMNVRTDIFTHRER